MLLTAGTLYSQQSLKTLYPLSHEVLSDSIVVFRWDSLPIITNYEFQLSMDSNFSQMIYDTIINQSEYMINLSNQYGKYYWRILVSNSDVNLISLKKSFVYFFPSYMENQVLWLIADSVQLNGTSVENWIDLSPTQYNPYQNIPSRQPQKIDFISELNNKSVIRFDGSDVLSIGDSLNLNKNDISIFLVGKSNATNGVYLGKDRVGDYNNTYALWYVSDRLRFKYSDGTSKQIYRDIGHGDYEIISVNTDRVNQSISFYTNGVSHGSSPLINDTNYIFSSTAPFNIGSSYTTNYTEYLNGDIAEIIIYKKNLKDSLRSLVEQYLRYKYSPPANLGANIYVPYGFCDTLLDASNRFVNYAWNTADTTSSIIVSDNGTYFIQTTDVFGYTSSDTVNVYYPEIFSKNLIDTTICLGDSLMLSSSLNKNGYNFLWSNSSNDSLLVVKSAGEYWVKVTDSLGCFQYSDTITVAVDSFPTLTTLGLDKTVCQYANLGLEVDNGGVSYLWSTTDTTIQTTVDTAGIYWVEVENDIGCIARDTIDITVNGIAPTVNFDVVGLCENAPTLLNNTSFTTDGSSMVAWNWDFGNGDTSTIENTQTNFAAGNYNVVLEVETDSGCTNKYQQQITIHQKPTAGFFPVNGLICSNQNATFTNNSFSSDGTINSWYWDFGIAGAADTSSLENGVYSFSNSGSFNVQLISTTTHGCSDTTSQFVSVKQTPSASFIIQDSCASSPIGFVNTSSGSLFSTFWDFGDFNSSSLANPTHTYSVAGVYNTKLIVKDLNGCWDTLATPITINENPEANFINDDFCVLSTIQLFDSSSTNSGVLSSWNWQILNTPYNSIMENPQFLFNISDTGVYNLKLKVTNNFGCIDSVIKTISIQPLPVPNFIFSPKIGLPPLEVNFTNNSTGANAYEWIFGDGNTSTSINPTHTYVDSNSFQIKLIATSLYGCVDSIINTIQIIDPIVDVAVKNIIYEFLPNSNLMRITAQIANEGVVAIETLDLILNNSSTGKVLEKWKGNILPGIQQLIELSPIIEMPRGEIPDVICVEALNPNDGFDNNLLNNKLCKSLDKFELVNVYPNPVLQNINIEYILPTAKNIEITLNNSIGEKVQVLFSAFSLKGFNSHQFNLNRHSNGIYFIQITDGETTIRKKIMIN